MLSKLKKLAKIAARPGCWGPLAHGVAATVEHAAALDGHEFRTIIDVGANKGQFAVYAYSRWPNARIVCFEPLAHPRAKLERVVGARAEIYACALGAQAGEGSMHVASREDSSSLLPLGEAQKTIFSMSEVMQTAVPIRRLDDVFTAPLSSPALLKIDVQGFELEVLKGGSETLKSVDFIYVELSLVELYEGQALNAEVTSHLSDAGFDKVGEFDAQYRMGRLLQSDVLFARRK